VLDKKSPEQYFYSTNLFTTLLKMLKHSIDISGKESYVKIEIDINHKQLHFICINSRSAGYSVRIKKTADWDLPILPEDWSCCIMIP
jgi:hypothetical protein